LTAKVGYKHPNLGYQTQGVYKRFTTSNPNYFKQCVYASGMIYLSLVELINFVRSVLRVRLISVSCAYISQFPSQPRGWME
jgi:hypothetical protein